MVICGECHNNNSCGHQYSIVFKDTCEVCKRHKNVVWCDEPFGHGDRCTDEKKDPKNPRQFTSTLYPAD